MKVIWKPGWDVHCDKGIVTIRWVRKSEGWRGAGFLLFFRWRGKAQAGAPVHVPSCRRRGRTPRQPQLNEKDRRAIERRIRMYGWRPL